MAPGAAARMAVLQGRPSAAACIKGGAAAGTQTRWGLLEGACNPCCYARCAMRAVSGRRELVTSREEVILRAQEKKKAEEERQKELNALFAMAIKQPKVPQGAAWAGVQQHGLWCDFDPTNNLLPALEHITLAWGRDFSDVSPLRGVILGGGSHDPDVQVTVLPLG